MIFFSPKRAAALVALAALVAPLASHAASLTTEQVNSVVSLLQTFNVDAQTVANVKASLTNTPLPHREDNDERRDGRVPQPGDVSTSTPPSWGGDRSGCITLMRDLHEGSRGEDVRELQKELAKDASLGFTGTTTGFFGPMTAKAMKRFQEKNGIASSTRATGSVGPMTRGFFESQCRKAARLGTLPPTPVASTSPTKFAPGQSGQ